MALRWRTRTNHVCAHEGTTTSQKKSGLAYSSSTQAVKNTCNGSVESKGFVITNAPMASNDILPSIPWVAVFHALTASVSDDQGLVSCWAITSTTFVPSRQSAKDHHFARPRYHRTNYPSLQQIYPQIMTKIVAGAICLSWLLCILLAKWINSSLSSSTLTISSAYRRILVLLALSRLLPPCPYQ